MDYGQPVKTNKQSAFFTSGAGTNQEDKNDFEPENNLATNNEQANWDVSYEVDKRNIGNIAINMPELPKDVGEKAMPDGEEIAEIGEIAETGLPPNEQIEIENTDMHSRKETGDKNDESSDATKIIPFNGKKIKTGEKLSVDGVDEVQNVINKLNQDGNVADFYDAAREMMETNLVNSYGANAAWKGEKVA